MRKLLLTTLLIACTACGGSSPAAPSNSYQGTWSGTTHPQGATLTFHVSAAQKITDITIGYNFNGCSGSRTFSGLSIEIARHLGSAGAGFLFESGAFGAADYTEINGTFSSYADAAGLVGFGNYSGGCGNGVASWTATRQ